MPDQTPPPASDRVKPTLAQQFARFWSCNMDLVHQKGQSWPLFSYTADEREAMHTIASNTPVIVFYFELALIVVFTILIAVICVGLMFLRMQLKYGSDPAKTPKAEFFFVLAMALVTTIAAGLPLSIMAASSIAARMFPASPDSLPDAQLSQQIFRKAVSQIVRIGVLATLGILIYLIFVPSDSKVNLILQAVIPMLGSLNAILSSIYYFSGRVGQTASVSPRDPMRR